MALYSAGVRTAAAASNVAYCELRTGANKARVKEIGAFTIAATASGLGLARPNAIGVTPTTTFPGYSVSQALDTQDPIGTTVLASAWGTAPTAPAGGGVLTGWIRRGFLAAAIGAGLIWTPPPGYESIVEIPASGSVAIYNLAAAAGSVLDVYFVWEE